MITFSHSHSSLTMLPYPSEEGRAPPLPSPTGHTKKVVAIHTSFLSVLGFLKFFDFSAYNEPSKLKLLQMIYRDLVLKQTNFLIFLKFKDATQVNFSQKTALYLLREGILTTRHLFGPKNEVSKLFKKINFYTMFVY